MKIKEYLNCSTRITREELITLYLMVIFACTFAPIFGAIVLLLALLSSIVIRYHDENSRWKRSHKY
jgi:hypothetical protein